MTAPAPLDVPTAVARGVRLFNRGRYLAAHQLWEEVWVAAEGADRQLLEALVQLATGLHMRTRRGATRGAEHLLGQALATLEDFRPGTQGIDVDALLADFGTYLEEMRAARRPHRLLDTLRLPRIR